MGRREYEEMAGIAEAVRVALEDHPTGDVAARLERELKAQGFLGISEDHGGEPERCGRCGGLLREHDHESYSDRVCRCGGRKERMLSYLDATDPERRMTLGTLDVSGPTMAATLAAVRGIVTGNRKRGILLMGLPGRGKTHLMVGLGRTLLDRDQDAGYYNVVRLISRIQDSYSDYGGETRRAIITSVASHEVVLLDDFGKEHASTNVESILYELFDALHAARTILVVATNVPARKNKTYRGSTLSERYDEAVRSRLRAMCERLIVKGEDRRQEEWEW